MAVTAARSGERVLAVSLDQAHSLGDVFGAGSAGGVAEVPVGPGAVEILELDTLALAGERWQELSRVAGLGGADADGDGLFGDELTVFPGVQELLGLAAVADRVDGGRFDRVVADCGPTADALRLLELPSAVSNYLERLWPRHRRLGRPPTTGRMYLAVGFAEQVDALSERLARLVQDRSRTAVTLVTDDRRVALAEARRGVTALALSGLAPQEIVVNRCRSGESSEAARELADAVDHAAVVPLPALDAEPIGTDALARVGDLLLAGRGAGAAGAEASSPDRRGAERPGTGESQAPAAGDGSAAFDEAVVRESGTGLDAVYAMELALPLADPSQVTLGRVGDDLIVGAAGVRRRVRLAPVLRRCVVHEADFGGGRLRVRFTPDPEVWPR